MTNQADKFLIGHTQAGIRKANRKDFLIFSLPPGTQCAGVFTLNAFCAAPVQVCKKHLAQTSEIRAWVVNTGCANAGTGELGLANAQQTVEQVAKALGIEPTQVLPFSTGVILEHLPMEKIRAAIPAAVAQLGQSSWQDAAESIMTTDTRPKRASAQVTVQGKTIHINGISKGAGMIKPNMATMLGFVVTDAGVEAKLLQKLVLEAADDSFNAITIDGDTSTNDSFVLAATQTAGVTFKSESDPGWQEFRAAIVNLCKELAQLIVRDGEGATKFITINIEGAKTKAEAKQVGYAIAHSPLVKTAFFASDPNLGRILAAIGYSGVPDLDVSRIRLFLDDVLVAEHGGRAAAYQEADGQRVMKQADITVRVELNRGPAQAVIYTCDLSHDYVSINADYRS